MRAALPIGVVFAGQVTAAELAQALGQTGRELVTPLAGVSVAERLGPIRIADRPSFGGLFSFETSEIYRIRFEALRLGNSGLASAQFEHRVSLEGQRR